MNRDDIIRMAREVHTGVVFMPEELVRFAELVAADAEREACAALCVEVACGVDAEVIEQAIRARGEQ